MADFLLHPWVIITLVLAVIIGNIAAFKYGSNIKYDPKNKPSSPKKDLERLIELDKAAHSEPETQEHVKKETKKGAG